MRPGSSEYALTLLLEVGAYARKPLTPRLPNIPVEMSFFFGDYDWMTPPTP